MSIYLRATVWAALLLVLALLARVGLADRQTVEILLLVLPIIVVTDLFAKRRCGVRARG
jgi:glucose-6-phosphate-specific signal transduction histidine kinase